MRSLPVLAAPHYCESAPHGGKRVLQSHRPPTTSQRHSRQTRNRRDGICIRTRRARASFALQDREITPVAMTVGKDLADAATFRANIVWPPAMPGQHPHYPEQSRTHAIRTDAMAGADAVQAHAFSRLGRTVPEASQVPGVGGVVHERLSAYSSNSAHALGHGRARLCVHVAGSRHGARDRRARQTCVQFARPPSPFALFL